MRIQNTWRDNQNSVSIEDNAIASAYLCWKIALARAKELYIQDFDYENDEQRVAVIREYLFFLVHVTDRLTYTTLNSEERIEYIQKLANETARHYQRNAEELFEPGVNHTSIYLSGLNERIKEYGTLTFEISIPGYQMLRSFGSHLQQMMSSTQSNKWVIDQTIEIDAPQAVFSLSKGISSLFSSSGHSIQE